MCGFAGILGFSGASHAAGLLVRRMADAIRHRGPDDEGVWLDEISGIALAHRRLAILDLTPQGHQPMISACERFVIVFNGEIYNWAELRAELEAAGHAPPWRGHSDTEVLLAAIAAWGLPVALSRTYGMFALALWDRYEKCLFLARDRVGEKPLYYGKISQSFVFGSELKALRALPDWRPQIDKDAAALFIRYGYVPTPYSIYKGVSKLSPGSILRVPSDGSFGMPETWWQFEKIATAGVGGHSHAVVDERAAVDDLEQVLGAAVSQQMVADVPLGALLSGGIDSSAIVSLMQAKSSRAVRTFTIGFSEGDYDEAQHAKAVAKHLGTDHTELHVTAGEARQIIPLLPDIYDEPFGDSSQIPTFVVCRLTRQHVSVCLSGDAGDELFGGYNRYFWAAALWKRMRVMPHWLRAFSAGMILDIPAGKWNRLIGGLGHCLPTRLQLSNPGDKLHKLAEVLGASSPEELYQLLVSQWRGRLPLRSDYEPPTPVAFAEKWPALSSFADRMMAIDTLTYLPDDILVKVDRAAMAASLETRVPFLDARVIDFAWSLPFKYKVRDGRGKWLLREMLYRYVPRELVERPKQGFGIPIEHWLRGPLREWAEDLLSREALCKDDLLDPGPIRAMWEKHLEGRNVQHALWNVLMYQAWRKRWG